MAGRVGRRVPGEHHDGRLDRNLDRHRQRQYPRRAVGRLPRQAVRQRPAGFRPGERRLQVHRAGRVAEYDRERDDRDDHAVTRWVRRVVRLRLDLVHVVAGRRGRRPRGGSGARALERAPPPAVEPRPRRRGRVPAGGPGRDRSRRVRWGRRPAAHVPLRPAAPVGGVPLWPTRHGDRDRLALDAGHLGYHARPRTVRRSAAERIAAAAAGVSGDDGSHEHPDRGPRLRA